MYFTEILKLERPYLVSVCFFLPLQRFSAIPLRHYFPLTTTHTFYGYSGQGGYRWNRCSGARKHTQKQGMFQAKFQLQYFSEIRVSQSNVISHTDPYKIQPSGVIVIVGELGLPLTYHLCISTLKSPPERCVNRELMNWQKTHQIEFALVKHDWDACHDVSSVFELVQWRLVCGKYVGPVHSLNEVLEIPEILPHCMTVLHVGYIN